jgi:hypothetical protein
MSYPEECPGENFQGKLSGGNLFKEKNVPQSEKMYILVAPKRTLK